MTQALKHESADYQRAVSEFVNREVIYCVSYMIDELQKDEKYSTQILDDIMSALDDWEEPALEHIRAAKKDELIEMLDANNASYDETDDENNLRDALIADVSDWQDFCRDNNIDPYQREIYEYWIVSPWLARKLEERGEPILRDFLGITTIWGRCCTGQAILLDSVICSIYDKTQGV